MNIKNIENLYNLEDAVDILVDKANFNFLGFKLAAKVANYDNLPGIGEAGAVYAVGTAAPYTYYTYVNGEWLNLGIWPLKGPKGQPGDKGDRGPTGPAGPKGDTGDQGATGPAGSGVGVNYITDLDLAVGDAAITYDTTVGASLIKQGKIVAAGTSYDVTVDDELPIIPGNNINIDASADGKHLIISATGGGSSSTMKIVTIGNGNSGTVSDAQMEVIAATAVLCVVKSNNEIYWRMDDQHTPGAMGYSHLGYENGKFIQKNITFTISTKSWVKTTKDVVTVNGKSGAVNLIAGTNVTITEDGNDITISASGGGGGSTTDTGFDNVRRIEYVDSQTSYDPNSGEYLNTTGTSTVYYKNNTSTTVPYVQTLGLMPGENITFTEELVDGAWKVKVNATGGGDTFTFPVVDLSSHSIPSQGNLTTDQAELIYNNKVSFVMVADTDSSGLSQNIVLPLIHEDTIHNNYVYEVEFDNNKYTASIVVSKTTGGAWGTISYQLSKSAISSSAAIYQHTLNLQYTSSTETYNVYITLINSFESEISLTDFLNIYGTDPLIGDWYGYKVSTGRPTTSIVKIAATSTGFVLTDSGLNEKEATLVSDTVLQV